MQSVPFTVKPSRACEPSTVTEALSVRVTSAANSLSPSVTPPVPAKVTSASPSLLIAKSVPESVLAPFSTITASRFQTCRPYPAAFAIAASVKVSVTAPLSASYRAVTPSRSVSGRS